MHLIRSAHSRDIEIILQIWLDASKQAHDFIPTHFWQDQLLNMRDVYLPMAENYVIEHNDVVMGFISLLKAEQFIAALFISPKFQGQGLGSALLGFAQQQSNELNLQVYSENKDAVLFYLNHGFQIINESIDEVTHHAQMDMHWIAQ